MKFVCSSVCGLEGLKNNCLCFARFKISLKSYTTFVNRIGKIWNDDTEIAADENFNTCQLSLFSWNLLVSQLEHQISWELSSMAYFKISFHYFVIFDISKRKIKQERDLLLLFELFSIGKQETIIRERKQSNQINVHLYFCFIWNKEPGYLSYVHLSLAAKTSVFHPWSSSYSVLGQ